jgi:hypothetical protein
MAIRKFLYDLHKLFDLLVIFENLPIINVIRDGRSVPHLNLIFHLRDKKDFKGTSFHCQGINLLVKFS